MSRTRPVLGALVASAALAAAGCGSSNDDPALKPAKPAATTASTTASAAAKPAAKKPTGPPPSKATYIKRADKVCRQAGEVSQKANAAFTKAVSKKQLTDAAEAIDRYAPEYEQKINEFHQLRRPEPTDKVLTSLHKLMDVQVQALKAEALAIRTQNAQRVTEIGAAQAKAKEFAATLAAQYGFRVCGRA